ncbi:hypothetical protein Scep_017296 [Stephania cephalantha]|uniref:Uncharacterized protein n=1 Tax=Stephania cephalantha TaxID=152367 RepID=A0AAP0IP85_9MAGN
MSQKGSDEDEPELDVPLSDAVGGVYSGSDCAKSVILVPNVEGIDAPGLASLVDALVKEGRCSVHDDFF